MAYETIHEMGAEFSVTLSDPREVMLCGGDQAIVTELDNLVGQNLLVTRGNEPGTIDVYDYMRGERALLVLDDETRDRLEEFETWEREQHDGEWPFESFVVTLTVASKSAEPEDEEPEIEFDDDWRSIGGGQGNVVMDRPYIVEKMTIPPRDEADRRQAMRRPAF